MKSAWYEGCAGNITTDAAPQSAPASVEPMTQYAPQRSASAIGGARGGTRGRARLALPGCEDCRHPRCHHPRRFLFPHDAAQDGCADQHRSRRAVERTVQRGDLIRSREGGERMHDDAARESCAPEARRMAL
jgi:hypothetical protein